MSTSEFESFLGYNKPAGRTFAGLTQHPAPIFHTAVKDLPTSVDWRTKYVFVLLKRLSEALFCRLNLMHEFTANRRH